jgi:hypothetical protein
MAERCPVTLTWVIVDFRARVAGSTDLTDESPLHYRGAEGGTGGMCLRSCIFGKEGMHSTDAAGGVRDTYGAVTKG